MPFPRHVEDEIHLLIPMSGMGQRFRDAGYSDPKPLIPVSGTPMIERVLKQFPTEWPCTFVLWENHRQTDLPDLLIKLRPNAELIWIDDNERRSSPFKGPALAVYRGLSHIPPESRVLISYCDYGMIWDARYFERFVLQSDCDSCLVSYRGFHAHYLSPTKYAYARCREEKVESVREKGCFTEDRESEYASVGAYYFKSARQLVAALNRQIQDRLEVQNEHYISLTVEALLRLDPSAHVRIFEILGFCQWGTPDDLRTFEYWERTFTAWNTFQKPDPDYHVEQVLMPMAGQGSRFRHLSPVPKPFIKIDHTPMFALAHNSLPRSGSSIFVALDKHRDYLELAKHQSLFISSQSTKPDTNAATFCYLSETPTGQALSTEAGLPHLAAEKEVIVTACDHEIVLDPAKWRAFHQDPQCDSAIFTVQGFPGTARQPTAFAYVIPESADELFPTVRDVSVKKPVSPHPRDDHLLVGTFWFRSASILSKYISLLKLSEQKVNGELYLDSIFPLMIKAGLTVRMIPLEGYIGRGDPDSLAESVYFQELFGGRSLTIKRRYPPPLPLEGA
jgi:NDP-sugar pyrophosphorylase family protein